MFLPTDEIPDIEMPTSSVLVILANVELALSIMKIDDESTTNFKNAYNAFLKSNQRYKYNAELKILFFKSNNVFNVGTGCKNQFLISPTKNNALFLNAGEFFPNVQDPYNSVGFFTQRGCCAWINRVKVETDPILKEIQETMGDQITFTINKFQIKIIDNIGITITLMSNYPFDPNLNRPGDDLEEKRKWKDAECNTQAFNFDELSDSLKKIVLKEFENAEISEPVMDKIFITGSTTILFPVWQTKPILNMSREVALDPRLMATVAYRLLDLDFRKILFNKDKKHIIFNEVVPQLRSIFEKLVRTNTIPTSFTENAAVMNMISMLNCNYKFINYLTEAIRTTKETEIDTDFEKKLTQATNLYITVARFQENWNKVK